MKNGGRKIAKPKRRKIPSKSKCNMVQGKIDKHFSYNTIGGSNLNPVGVKRKVDAEDDDQMLEERTLKRKKTSLTQKPENRGPKSSIRDDPENFPDENSCKKLKNSRGNSKKKFTI